MPLKSFEVCTNIKDDGGYTSANAEQLVYLKTRKVLLHQPVIYSNQLLELMNDNSLYKMRPHPTFFHCKLFHFCHNMVERTIAVFILWPYYCWLWNVIFALMTWCFFCIFSSGHEVWCLHPLTGDTGPKWRSMTLFLPGLTSPRLSPPRYCKRCWLCVDFVHFYYYFLNSGQRGLKASLRSLELNIFF